MKDYDQWIGILIVDDQPVFRKAVRILIERDPHLIVLGEAEDGLSAIKAVGLHMPDVVLMDLNMPVMGGLEATKIISARFPKIRIIMLTMHNDAQTEALSYKAGACRFLSKDGKPSGIIDAIKSATGDRRALAIDFAPLRSEIESSQQPQISPLEYTGRG